MIKLFVFFIICFVATTKTHSTNVVVIDVNTLINNSSHFLDISEKINNSQLEYKEKFKEIEKNLYKKKSELENLKLILSEDEFNLKKNTYYQEVANFENDINNFNTHYENQIINIKNKIFSKISELIQEHASNNEIDLILDKNQYLIASEKINITEIIFSKLNNSKIILEFEKYEY